MSPVGTWAFSTRSDARTIHRSQLQSAKSRQPFDLNYGHQPDRNPNSPAEIACGHCESITDLPFYSQFPYLQYIDQMSDTAVSNYNALQATLTARNFHNLSFIAGYTYSHALDDLPGGDFHVVNPQNSLNPLGDYGAAQFDIRHHFSFTPTYNIPGKKSPGQLLEGWVLSSAIVFETGQPWSPTDTTDLSGTNELQDRWNFYGTPSDFNATFNPPAFYPGNITLANGTQVINPGLPQECVQQATAIGSFNPANPNNPQLAGFSTLAAYALQAPEAARF